MKVGNSEVFYRSFFQYSMEAVFLTEPSGANFAANPAACELFGLTEDEICRVGRSGLVDQSSPQLAGFLEERARTGKARAELVFIRGNGTRFPGEVSSAQFTDEHENVRTILIVRDITARKKAELEKEQYLKFFNISSDLMGIADPNGEFKRINPAFINVLGYSENEILAKPFIEFVHPDDRQPTLDEMKRQLQRGFSLDFENRYVCKDGSCRWLSWKANLSIDEGITYATARDITERKRTDAGLQRLNRSLRTISSCNEVLVHATDENELLQNMCRTIVEIGHYRFAWVGYAEHDDAKSVRPVARFGVDDGFLDKAGITWADIERGQGPTGTAIRTSSVQANQNFATNPKMSPWREEGMKRGFGSSIALPLTDEFGTFGAITIYASEPDAFDTHEVELLTELAGDLAYGITAARIREERDRAFKDLQLASKVFEGSKEGILITDAKKNILTVNRSFTTITGYGEEEVLGRNPMVIKSDRHDASFYANMWASINQTGHWMGEIWNRRKNGEVFPVLQSITAIRDQLGTVTNYLGFFADITYNKESEDRIQHLTQYDALTGLANRSLLMDRLEQAIVHAGRTGRLVAVIILGVDRIKLINDSLGHVAGDTVLKKIADCLSENIRPGDTVARMGGDEFVLVMSDVACENDAVSLVRKLLDVVAAPMAVNEQNVVVTASFGVALFPRNGELATSLLKNADAAMHRAKELGRNCVQFYAPEMNARMLEQLELESGLRRAIERREFILYYQPKVDLNNGQITGAEALIRWHHPEKGMVSPGDFIPIAEDTGLIVPIGEWVLEAACEQLKSWQNAGLPDITLAVNLSGRQFQQENLAELVMQSLRVNDLQAQYLELEVTESAVMQNPERTTTILRRLKEIGVSISLDDFGTGYSSLNYLKRFPIDIMKIDQSFVRDITTDPDDAAITLSVISLAHSLKHKVVAEGVETEAQLAFLRSHNCDQIQGYYFSRPLPAEEFAQLLRAGKNLYG